MNINTIFDSYKPIRYDIWDDLFIIFSIIFSIILFSIGKIILSINLLIFLIFFYAISILLYNKLYLSYLEINKKILLEKNVNSARFNKKTPQNFYIYNVLFYSIYIILSLFLIKFFYQFSYWRYTALFCLFFCSVFYYKRYKFYVSALPKVSLPYSSRPLKK